MSGRKRADPVNVDGGAAFDVGWIKKAADTVLPPPFVLSGHAASVTPY